MDNQEQEDNPPESVPEQTRDNDTPPPVGQQSHLNGGAGGNNEITPGNTDIEPEQAVVRQTNQLPAVDQEQSQITFGETSAEERESNVALQLADDNARSASQVLPQDSEMPAVFRYLVFILIGLAAAAIVLTLIFLKAAPRK